MKTRYYCKRCGNIQWIESYDKKLKISITKAYCQFCKGSPRLWKVKPNSKIAQESHIKPIGVRK